MLVIRLSRTGKKHSPHYRIVVQEKRSKLNGKAIDQIGHYHPAEKSKELVLDKEKVAQWLAKGAQPSDTVTNLLVKEKILKAEQKVTFFYTPKAKEEAKEEKKAEAAPAATEETEETTEAPAETPTEEAPAEEATPAEAPATEETPAEAAPEETPTEPEAQPEETKEEPAA